MKRFSRGQYKIGAHFQEVPFATLDIKLEHGHRFVTKLSLNGVHPFERKRILRLRGVVFGVLARAQVSDGLGPYADLMEREPPTSD